MQINYFRFDSETKETAHETKILIDSEENEAITKTNSEDIVKITNFFMNKWNQISSRQGGRFNR